MLTRMLRSGLIGGVGAGTLVLVLLVSVAGAAPHRPPGPPGPKDCREKDCQTSVPTNTPTAVVTTSTPTPTMVMLMPTPTPTSGSSSGGDGASGNSAAYGIWTPAAQDSCTKAEHDAFYVVGPDGLRYPTWHPSVMTRADGSTCSFGHEHGSDPRASAEFTIAARHYAHRLADGSLDLAHAGIPFGYVNNQMDAWETATGSSLSMRHEDHVGHKTVVVDNFPIMLNHLDGGPQFPYPGVLCNYIVQYHQGTHSRDAFENNLHEVMYNEDCSDGHSVHVDEMGEFGPVGGFAVQCNGDGRTGVFTSVGTDYANPNFPGTRANGDRAIGDRTCVESSFLVPPGQWSANPYEAWTTSIGINGSAGQALGGLNLLFDVEDAIRYYYPGQPNNVGYFQDTCYETLGDRQFRGGLCNGIPGLSWDSPQSWFRDVNRGLYLKSGITSGSSTDWYTDPFGDNAQTSAWPGSIHQQISADNKNYAALAGASETANVFNHLYSDGNATVHAPN